MARIVPATPEGEAQARRDRMRAAALRFSGDVEANHATTTLVSGAAGSMHSKYFSKPTTDLSL